jgi:hypothetical protein
MVPVAQWQSASLWMRRLRVRNRPGTPQREKPRNSFWDFSFLFTYQKNFSRMHQQPKENTMTIQRIVCFKFKAGTSEEAIQQHMQDFGAMEDAIPQIREYRGGRTKPGDNNAPPAFDTMHYLTYNSMEDIDLYIPHAAHQSFIARNRENWESVLVLNSEIGLVSG